ncbi:MAG TPA: type II toxin-antitoxin system RelE/ParE family toxin [Spirochaetota bacterium]|nr:MAG: hypothetical protein BWX91_00483 [Spirochaetes bacterium ADurb.Bin133]HNZ26767.1 type II toxin-antitoxin system RelE/ParE family toxin [Spirochaetota bacterium]HPY86649.1 type II toxin-antitoxin system RelE/ParE family toxin [Spirochaetota bacterium]HQB60484.1 type II toxin-antitoxin system RelE/ParE family toxin [Spirochaetota bacterium]
MYKIEISKSVEKFLKSRNRNVQIKISKMIDVISVNPFITNLDIKELKGNKNHYRLRVGKYRILYEIIDEKILIYFYKADSRGDIYKKSG